jgi:hypothetical protein
LAVSQVVHIIQLKSDVILCLDGICVEIYLQLNLCYAVLYCSLHGLIRGENMELGRDSDTGGQVLVSSVHLFIESSIAAILSSQ